MLFEKHLLSVSQIFTYIVIAVLLMKCTAIYGGRLDFEEFEACEQIDFREISY